MDSNFVDLDILLTRIKNPRSKTYFLEAIRSYKAGALRAALSSTWVAVVYDLIAKYRELSAMGDTATTAFLQKWDAATAQRRDVKKLLELERSIITDATANTQLLDRLSETQLERLREDRHLCAHPAFSTEADLFEPTPELVRLHLVNAIQLVLSQEPLQGKAIFEQFNIDVQTPGFPSTLSMIPDYVEQRYLTRIRPRSIHNFGIVLAKALLKDIPPEWEPHRKKIVASLVTVRERAPELWQEVFASIVRLIDSLEPAHRLRAIAFVGEFPDFWSALEPPTRTALITTAANIQPAQLHDFRVLSAVRLDDFRERITPIIEALTDDQLGEAVAIHPLPELWPRALEAYEQSGSFRGSERNFRDFINPFTGALRSRNVDKVLTAIADNGQNWDAADTPQLLLGLLKNTTLADFPTHEGRDDFYNQIKEYNRIDRFEDVFALFKADGWNPPPAPPPDHQ